MSASKGEFQTLPAPKGSLCHAKRKHLSAKRDSRRAGRKSPPVARRGKIDYSISLKNQQSANEVSVKADAIHFGVEPGGHNQKDLQP